jgi:hypothetical protein
MQVEARVLQYQEFHVTNVGDESTVERAYKQRQKPRVNRIEGLHTRQQVLNNPQKDLDGRRTNLNDFVMSNRKNKATI